ncbi:DUF1648 domain-containing protein [Metallumcola ferriviriculae]|uniref:DUF1648 domain-containing protein n=1 Tax=Metallumcola ferriviriculae TaxID=3039180 RepID=A0AAU0UJQ5_9FIRM|nr:DUF1648 domain-containing protein [Desulfitibacteraceae bacterium MK1]
MNKDIKINWEWPLLLLVIGTLAVGIWAYPQLPDQVPMHWNVQGEVDDYGSRLTGAFAIPLLNVAIYFLFIFLPRLDPKYDNYRKFSEVYRIFRYAMHLFFTGLYLVTIATALGNPLPIGRIVPAGVALLLLVIGNYLGRVRHNYFLGIRTPWTLANEEVWRKTHRLTGYLWTGTSLTALVAALMLPQDLIWMVFFPLILGPPFFAVGYSYWLYRRISH